MTYLVLKNWWKRYEYRLEDVSYIYNQDSTFETGALENINLKAKISL